MSDKLIESECVCQSSTKCWVKVIDQHLINILRYGLTCNNSLNHYETKFAYFLFSTCMSEIRNREFRLYI